MYDKEYYNVNAGKRTHKKYATKKSGCNRQSRQKQICEV